MPRKSDKSDPLKWSDAWAIRVTHGEFIPWDQVCKRVVFWISGMEFSVDEKKHSHTCIQFTDLYSRETIISQLKKRYPQLKGNGHIQMKPWDHREEAIDYFFKTYDEEADPDLHQIGSYRRYGERIGLKSPSELKAQRLALIETRAQEKAQSKDSAYDWCVKHCGLTASSSSLEVCDAVYRYYSECKKGCYPGSLGATTNLARSILFKLNHSSAQFRERWVLDLHNYAFR